MTDRADALIVPRSASAPLPGRSDRSRTDHRPLIEGLLAPSRTSGGQRRYADGAVERVRWIQLLLGAGLPSKTIRDFLPCVESGEVTPEVLRRLARERGRIDRQVTELLTVRDRLDALIATAEEHGPVCRGVPEAAEGREPILAIMTAPTGGTGA